MPSSAEQLLTPKFSNPFPTKNPPQTLVKPLGMGMGSLKSQAFSTSLEAVQQEKERGGRPLPVCESGFLFLVLVFSASKMGRVAVGQRRI